MKDIYRLKDMICDELDEYGRKGELSAGSLDVIDKLSHAAKSLATLIAMEEAGYSENYPYYRGTSYARGRGRNVKRDSMGRYSREYSEAVDDMIEQLHEMMESAPDEETKADIQRLVHKFEKK